MGAADLPVGTVLPFFGADGAANFTITGRLKTDALAGNITAPRSTYKADTSGNVTDLDVYTKASPTIQARLPAQPVATPVVPVINFYDQACGNALTTDPVTGLVKVGPGPYTAPAGLTPHNLASTGNDFWGQSSPGGLPPSHVCIEDTTSRNIAGQIVPTYTLVPVTDQVTITTAHYVGPQNGTLTVNAVSSDPTAVPTLAGYGPGVAGSPGVAIGIGAGTGLDLAGGAAQVLAMAAPPSKVQVVSTKGGKQLRETDTAHGAAILLGIPAAVNDSVVVNEDCSAVASLGCAAGGGVTVDLLANDTVMLDGVMRTLRDVVTSNLATVTVSAQAPRLGAATVTADGILTYMPNPNANGTDNVNYTVTVNGNVSNQAVVAVTITPVNDVPVAGNQTTVAVNGNANNTLSLLTGATDPDGNNDVKDAVIVSWPAQLGPQPVPSNGVITYTPNSPVNNTYTVSYQVRDAAGVLSANVGTASVSVVQGEVFQNPTDLYTISKGRWVIGATDTVRQGQTVTIAFTNGTIRATGQSCATVPQPAGCIIGTTQVPANGVIAFDQLGFTGTLGDPTSNLWSSRPTSMRIFSSSPNLGGSSTPFGVSTK
jgi:VCBS repeat-containing protein